MRAVGSRVLHAKPTELRLWQSSVAYEARVALPPEWSPVGAMTARLAFLTSYPANAYSKRSADLTPAWSRKHKVTAPDLDKLVRAVFDALTQAGVWADDSQCVDLVASKRYGYSSGLRATITHAP